MLEKLKARVQQIYKEEKDFITNSVLSLLPESGRVKCSDTQVEDEYIIDSDDAEPKQKDSVRRKLFHETQYKAKAQRSYNHGDLKARLHNKIAELSKQRVENQNSEKRKRKAKKKSRELAAKKKTFTSLSNPNLVNQNQGQKPSTSNPLALSDAPLTKTPLQKKQVKKTNGEIVYSKFDFISDGRKPIEFMQGKPPSGSKPELELKSVIKHQLKVEKLKGQGKVSTAVSAVDKQKWNNALQRAKGVKIRDDPKLLRKTINKQNKMKQAKQKKWHERVDQQEKLKGKRQEKRQTNIKAKRDEKMTRRKKLLRKRGRII